MSARRDVWAIVPAKAFGEGKSRLEPVLGPRRPGFARDLLVHVLGELAAARTFAGMLVATSDEEVAGVARAHGAETIADPPWESAAASRLAGVVDAALRRAHERGAAAALVLMADLPRFSAADARDLVAALETHDAAIVADARGVHTNALLLPLPAPFATRFGTRDSFATHCAAARAAGLRLAILENARVAFDVDDPSDLAAP